MKLIEEFTTGPDAKTVRLLEGYGYRVEAVRRWTADKAKTVLNACKKEEAIALRRAKTKAVEQDGEASDAPSRGQPSIIERMQAALTIEQAMENETIDNLTQAVAYTIYCLSDDETKRFAGFLIRVFRGEQAKPKPQPLPQVEQCSLCSREVTAEDKPKLAGVEFCDRTGKSALNTAEPRCPYKPRV